MTALTQERVRALFDYNPESGILVWRERPTSDFATIRACKTWNNRFSGKEAQSDHNTGYYAVRIDYKAYLVHRIIWLYVFGNLPENIDHKNHNRKDNRLVNLREVTRQENQRNLSRSKRNSSGITGVRQNKKTGRWTADIRANNRVIFLGSFETKDHAVAARRDAEKRFGYHPNHGRSFRAEGERRVA